jgi:hypothetical protein
MEDYLPEMMRETRLEPTCVFREGALLPVPEAQLRLELKSAI